MLVNQTKGSFTRRLLDKCLPMLFTLLIEHDGDQRTYPVREIGHEAKNQDSYPGKCEKWLLLG